MTVYKNMAFALELRKVPKDEIDKKVREAAKILELTEYLDRKPLALSGGQRQRVALGRAMVRDPEVFLLDEPLSNLDAKLRTEMRSQIAALHKRLQTTFVYVTHDQTEAMTMGDRICVMKDGIIQQFDTPQNLYHFPDNLFVAGFIGSPQMNFIDAAVEKTADGYELVFEGTRVPSKVAALENYVGKTVILGVRPEHISADPEFIAENPGCSMNVHIDLAEMMGSEDYLYFNIQGQKVIARIPSGKESKEGKDIQLAIDPERIHVFDKDTELVIR